MDQALEDLPCFLVKKSHSNNYWPLQDLRDVNKQVEDIHPTVPNPYTLLISLPPEHTTYTMLDLKDAFFRLPLALKSQPVCLRMARSRERLNRQPSWTYLPQGFRNSPTIFDEALCKDLGECQWAHPQQPYSSMWMTS